MLTENENDSVEKKLYNSPQLLEIGKIIRDTKGANGSACDGNDTNINGSTIPCA